MGNLFSIISVSSNIPHKQKQSADIAKTAASKVANSLRLRSSLPTIRSEQEIKALRLSNETEKLLKVIQHIFVPCHDFADVNYVKMIHTSQAHSNLKQELVYFTQDPEHFLLSERTSHTMH